MKVVDLQKDQEAAYYLCLEDWSDEIRESGDHKEKWYRKLKSKGLRVKVALDDKGTLGGMIQYLPIEHSVAEGKDLYFINCIWVHGHKQGRGNFQKQGMGKALLSAAEDDAARLGAKGIVAWGLSVPAFMRASWFKKHGYKRVDRDGIQELVWKPFAADALAPRWIKPRKRPQPVAGKVTVSGFLSGWCPAQSIVFERARRAVGELGEKAVFKAIDTSERSTFLEWGISDALFVDGRQIRTGPPPSYQKIKAAIARRIKRSRG